MTIINNSDIRVYIVEDKAFELLALENILARNHFIIAGSESDANKAWKEIQLLDLDIILLDINLAGDKNGIWLAQKIRTTKQVPIVYLTAFGDLATRLEVLSTKPNGYLSKPYDEPTLLTTIQIAISNYQDDTRNETKQEDKYIFIKHEHSIIHINVDEILFIKSDGNYLHIFTTNRKYTTRSKMDEFLDKLYRKEVFLKVHLRYVVSIAFVKEMKDNKIFINQHTIPVSRPYRSKVKAALAKQ